MHFMRNVIRLNEYSRDSLIELDYFIHLVIVCLVNRNLIFST